MKAELEKDMINYDVIKKYLTIYLCTIAIPDFKRQRVEAYMRAMSRMTKDEIANANYTLDCWSKLRPKNRPVQYQMSWSNEILPL